MNDTRFSLRKRLKSFVYAFRGIGLLVRHEHNARIHSVAAAAAVTAGFVLRITPVEWTVIVLVIGAVLAAEAFNSALEALCDFVSPGYHESIKKAKDLAAGAVLLVAIAAAIIGAVIFLPRILTLLNS
ncbi:MAG: diacylglycerol kinase family protein [Parabacteroides sp.]|nr:diacylglycerol kinase family protein [Parabacteroides sp.]